MKTVLIRYVSGICGMFFVLLFVAYASCVFSVCLPMYSPANSIGRVLVGFAMDSCNLTLHGLEIRELLSH